MHKILVITDDILMEKSLDIIISKDINFNVFAKTSDINEILNFCEKKYIDIVFLDSQTKYIDIFKLCNNIKSVNSNISIFIISHPNEIINNWQISKEYIKDIIEKPVTYKRVNKVFQTYSTESDNFVQIYLDEVFEYIQNNDYEGFYFRISNLIDEIYLNFQSDNIKIVDIFRFIAKKFSETRIYHEDSKDLLELFPINESLILDKKVSEIWLFKIVDYLFQKKCIDRYPLLDNILHYINNHIKDKITLNDITDSCAISQGYLSRIFREQLNVSVMDYIHMRKMYLAKVYFYFTNDSIAEAAFKLGYNESSYFSKVFKKYEGKTVKEYKNE